MCRHPSLIAKRFASWGLGRRGGAGDFAPLDVNLGKVGVFFGILNKYFVPVNVADKTRVSIDFRVGVEGWFDKEWSMKGTKSEHKRRQIVL